MKYARLKGFKNTDSSFLEENEGCSNYLKGG